MTLKSLMNFGNFGKDHHSPVDRYQGASRGYHHSGSGGWYRGGRRLERNCESNSKGKGGTGAALSALTLLAFLFLINVMQQSLQDTNSTMPTMAPTMFVVREGELPIILDAKEEKEVNRQDDTRRTPAKSKIQRLNNQYIK